MTDLIPVNDMEKMSNVMAKLFQKTPGDLMALMFIAQAEGKHPAIAAQEYDIIQGRPALNSRAALSRFQTSGGRIEYITRTDKEVTVKFYHEKGGELEVTWNEKKAIQAGLWGKDNWKKYPGQMLTARVMAEGIRAIYPACLGGFYTDDETRDFDPPQVRDVTPEKTFEEPTFSKPVETVEQIPSFEDEAFTEWKSLRRQFVALAKDWPEDVKVEYRDKLAPEYFKKYGPENSLEVMKIMVEEATIRNEEDNNSKDVEPKQDSRVNLLKTQISELLKSRHDDVKKFTLEQVEKAGDNVKTLEEIKINLMATPDKTTVNSTAPKFDDIPAEEPIQEGLF